MNKKNKQTKTVPIPENLHARLKTASIKHGCTIRELVERLLWQAVKIR